MQFVFVSNTPHFVPTTPHFPQIFGPYLIFPSLNMHSSCCPYNSPHHYSHHQCPRTLRRKDWQLGQLTPPKLRQNHVLTHYDRGIYSSQLRIILTADYNYTQSGTICHVYRRPSLAAQSVQLPEGAVGYMRADPYLSTLLSDFPIGQDKVLIPKGIPLDGEDTLET